MKAVNLIPNELRSAGAGAPARTGSGVYVVLGALAVLVVLVGAWALAGRQVADKEADLVRAKAAAQEAEVRAGALDPYVKFATLRAERVETVTSLSRSRFNWPYALREASRVLPGNVWLTSMFGTVAPGVGVEGAAAGSAGSLRAALPSPAIEITGCTTDQANVARYLARLRSVDGVTRVALAASEKLAQVAGNGAGGGEDCRRGNTRYPKFDLVVFFERSTATASNGPAAAPAPTTPTNGTTK